MSRPIETGVATTDQLTIANNFHGSFLTLIWVRGHSRSFKLVPFVSLGKVTYLHSIVTMTVSCIVSNIKQQRLMLKTAMEV